MKEPSWLNPWWRAFLRDPAFRRAELRRHYEEFPDPSDEGPTPPALAMLNDDSELEDWWNAPAEPEFLALGELCWRSIRAKWDLAEAIEEDRPTAPALLAADAARRAYATALHEYAARRADARVKQAVAGRQSRRLAPSWHDVIRLKALPHLISISSPRDTLPKSNTKIARSLRGGKYADELPNSINTIRAFLAADPVVRDMLLRSRRDS